MPGDNDSLNGSLALPANTVTLSDQLQMSMASANSTVARLKNAASKTASRVAGAASAVAVPAAKVGAVITAPVWVPVAAATAAVTLPPALIGYGIAKANLKVAEKINEHLEKKADVRFETRHAEMVDALSKPLPGGLTTRVEVRNLLASHIAGSETKMSPDEAVRMATMGEHICKALADGRKVGPNGLAVTIPGPTPDQNQTVLVPPGNFASRAVSWHMMAVAAQSDIQRRQQDPGSIRSDMTNSGTFIMKDPDNRIYDFLNANPMVMDRMSTHYEERLDHNKHVPVLGKTLQKGCDDYQDKLPGGGGALLFDKMKNGELFVKFEHAGTPSLTAREDHQGKFHVATRSVLALDRWRQHSLSFLDSLKSGPGDPNKVVRQEHIHKGEMKAAVYEPYLTALQEAKNAGVITSHDQRTMASHARSHGLPSVQAGLDILEARRQLTPDPLSPACLRAAEAAQTVQQNMDDKIQSMGQSANDLGIQRRGGEVHISADPNQYLQPAAMSQSQKGFDPPSVLPPTAFTLTENESKSNAQASETFTLRSADGTAIGAKGETLAFAKPQFDPSQFQALKQQQTGLQTQIESLEKNSADLKAFKALEAEINSIPMRVDRADKELEKSQASLDAAQSSGDAAAIQRWQGNVDDDKAALDNLRVLQAQIPQSQEQLAQLAKAPDVVSYQNLVTTKTEVGARLTPIATIAETSSPLYNDAEQRNLQADLGGDRALLARSVASHKLDQLLGTHVIAEEKMAQAPDGRLMGVSVQVDGAQIVGKYQGKDCFLQADYSDPRIQKGLSDLETMDYLTGQIDRHHGNVFVDPSTGKVTGIDNDLCFPERDREVMLASDKALKEKAVAGMPRQMSEDTAKKILSITPERLTKELSSVTNPDGTGGLSSDEIQGAVQRLENLQAAIKDPSSGLQVVKEFNQDTFKAAVRRQQEVYSLMNSEAVLNVDHPDFRDVDNVKSLVGVHKGSYVGAAVMQGRSYELKEGMVVEGVEVGLRDPATAGIKAAAAPDFAAFKAEEQKAKQTFSKNPEFIEDLGTRREAVQVKEQMAAVQAKLDGYQKRLDKLENPGFGDRAQAVLTHGGVDKSRDFFHEKQQAALQEMKALEQKMDALTEKAVAPIRTDLYLAAQEKLAEPGPAARIEGSGNPKLDQMRDIANEQGVDLKMVELVGPDGQAQTPNAMRQIAANKEINAETWRERGNRAIEKNDPAEAKIAFAKADREQAFASAIRTAAGMLEADGDKLNPNDIDKLHEAFSSAEEVNQKHNIEEAVQNEQRLGLYEQEVENAVTPVLQAQGFSAPEIKAFSQAATQLGLEAESSVLKNNSEYAQMFAADLKRGLETSDFNYSNVNESASKLHDALYKAYETKAHVHDDGDIEIKRGHASFQEKRANIILNETAAANQVALAPVKLQPAAQIAPQQEPPKVSVSDSMKSLSRTRSSPSLSSQAPAVDDNGADKKADVRSSLRLSRSETQSALSTPALNEPDAEGTKQKTGMVAKLKEKFDAAAQEQNQSVSSEKPKVGGTAKRL